MLSIFSCVCWPSVCLLWRNVYLGLPPIILIGLLVCLILSCMTAIRLLGIYPEKTRIQNDTCTLMVIAAQFTIARTWKQPKCPSTEEWIKKMWYIYTMEYYSAIKRNETVSFAEMWMDLETVIQSEVSQKEKNKYRILTPICGL